MNNDGGLPDDRAHSVPFDHFNPRLFQLYHDSLLLTAGDPERFNAMTIS